MIIFSAPALFSLLVILFLNANHFCFYLHDVSMLQEEEKWLWLLVVHLVVVVLWIFLPVLLWWWWCFLDRACKFHQLFKLYVYLENVRQQDDLIVLQCKCLGLQSRGVAIRRLKAWYHPKHGSAWPLGLIFLSILVMFPSFSTYKTQALLCHTILTIIKASASLFVQTKY